MAVGPSLVEFLTGKSLASAPELRTRVLHHCLAEGDLPICCWIAVLDAVVQAKFAVEVVLDVVELFKEDVAIQKWARAAATDASLPLVIRLRLHVLLDADVAIASDLHAEAVGALLAGDTIPSEVLHLLDVPYLWQEVLRQDVHFAAAVLVDHLPASSLQQTPEVISFLQRGLVHSKRGHRRACIEVLRAIFSASEAALLSLLSEQQPLHLLGAVEDPPHEFHDIAAKLVLRYGDSRVQDTILGRLSISDEVLLSDLAFAASRCIGSIRPPNWVVDWQRKAGLALCRQGFVAVEALLEKPFPQGSIATLLDTWEQGLDADIASLPNPGMIRKLRRQAPDTSKRFARTICSVRDPQLLDHDMVLELLLCQDSGEQLSFSSTACKAAAKLCSRRDLSSLAKLLPEAVIETLLSDGAAGALEAIGMLPEIIVVGNAEGFTLQVEVTGATYGPVPWSAAFDACVADPTLAKNYPSCDPDYSSVRCKLLGLGPIAAGHASVTDEATMQKWSNGALTRYEKIEWLSAALKLLQEVSRLQMQLQQVRAEKFAAAKAEDFTAAHKAKQKEAALWAELSLLQDDRNCFAKTAKSAAISWANTAVKDDALVRAALAVLVAVGGGAESFESVWAAVKSCSVASDAVQLLGVGDVPAILLERILYSSTLSSALAALHIRSATRSVSTLALLAVRAAAHSGSFASPGHPAIQICTAVPDMPADFCAALLHQLLREELPLLQPEGSAKGEPHHRHMRLWLCVGTLLQRHAALAEEVAVAAEAFLRETMLFPTRVLVQNVWARAAWSNAAVLQRLTRLLQDTSLTDGFSARCIAVAAQLLLHPEHAERPKDAAPLDESDEFRPLLKALIGWSASYVQNPRLLASLALFHALERGLINTPGWYLTALHDSVAHGPAFQKLREHIHMDRWVSDAWKSLQHSETKCPLDVSVSVSQKHVSSEFWTAPDHDCASDTYQRRPAAAQACGSANIVVIGSFLDNLPNMAGLVRTSEALLGGCAEVTLHSTKVLTDPSFLKMSVAAERAGHILEVPQGPRLMAYIREKRAEGFTVAALEQTSKSVTLSLETKLPERLVLFIGNEQQGLPAWLVQSGLVDIFFELPLLGQTGSLNAHITAAMVLWQYRLQH